MFSNQWFDSLQPPQIVIFPETYTLMGDSSISSLYNEQSRSLSIQSGSCDIGEYFQKVTVDTFIFPLIQVLINHTKIYIYMFYVVVQITNGDLTKQSTHYNLLNSVICHQMNYDSSIYIYLPSRILRQFSYHNKL